ncbi:hypothetical protein ACIRD3_03325 [Kitasatospora sp. NPDC093550]|uniref:hypothetical protein n=1 Tax=Kitasatospora sp. NPDC093550 TaxID=3364089 RepID=UPI003819EFD3
MPDLTPVIAACTRWLLNAYPPPGGAFSRTLAETQARQATALAAALRYPTAMDVQLLDLLGPGGADRLDRLTGSGPAPDGSAWRSWVDETVVSWAACLLADPVLAAHAHRALATTEHHSGTGALRRLTHPGPHDTQAAVLLRHPDLLEPVAALHRIRLLERLNAEGVQAA